MSTIHVTKIGSVTNLAAGAVSTFQWNNPPWSTALSYTAYPVPPAASGPHGVSIGSVAVTKVTITWKRDNYNGDHQQVVVEVTNTGTGVTGYDLYQSWVA